MSFEFLSNSGVVSSALTLIAVMNPFGNVPLFMSMTEDFGEVKRRKAYKAIALSGLGIVLGFGLLGNILMKNFFKVDLQEIRIAGGMILIVIAFRNLIFAKKEKKNSESELSEEEAIQLGITPMAFPMLVGPGTMATSLILRYQVGILTTALGACLTFLVIYLLLINSWFLEKILGKLVLYLLSRIMQIFIMAVGVRLIIVGIKEVIGLMP